MIIQHTLNPLPARVQKVEAIVIHCTGDDDGKKCLNYYHQSSGKECPHYYIDAQGQDYEIADPGLVAWHAAIYQPEGDLYRQGYGEWSKWHWSREIGMYHIGQEMAGYRTWRDTWGPKGHKSPLDLVTGDKPNFVSVGIEVQTLVTPTALVFNASQYESLAIRLVAIAKQFSIPLDRDHIHGHYDVNPIRRSNEYRGGTDPGENFSWNYLWDIIASVQKGPRP